MENRQSGTNSGIHCRSKFMDRGHTRNSVPNATHSSSGIIRLNMAIANTTTSISTVRTHTFLYPFSTASATCRRRWHLLHHGSTEGRGRFHESREAGFMGAGGRFNGSREPGFSFQHQPKSTKQLYQLHRWYCFSRDACLSQGSESEQFSFAFIHT